MYDIMDCDGLYVFGCSNLLSSGRFWGDSATSTEGLNPGGSPGGLKTQLTYQAMNLIMFII